MAVFTTAPAAAPAAAAAPPWSWCCPARVPAAHQVGITAHVAAFLDLLQYFFEGRFQLPFTLYAFLLLLLSICQDCLGPCSFDGEMLPHPAQKLFHSKYSIVLPSLAVRLVELAFRCCNACTS